METEPLSAGVRADLESEPGPFNEPISRHLLAFTSTHKVFEQNPEIVH